MGKIVFVELHDFDTSTEKEQKGGHLWLAFTECSVSKQLIDWLVGGNFMQWLHFDFSNLVHTPIF